MWIKDVVCLKRTQLFSADVLYAYFQTIFRTLWVGSDMYEHTLDLHQPPLPQKNSVLFVVPNRTPHNGEEVLDAAPCQFPSHICENWEELSPESSHHLPELSTWIHSTGELLDPAGHTERSRCGVTSTRQFIDRRQFKWLISEVNLFLQLESEHAHKLQIISEF